MVEYLLGAAAIFAMFKVADADGRSGVVWGVITLFIVIGCFFIPLPFLRVLIALIIAFVALMVRKGFTR